MIQEVLIIANSLIFLLIGFYLGRPHTTTIEKPANPQADKTAKPKRNILEKAGIIEYASQDQVDYYESGQDKIDRAKVEAFMPNLK